MKKGIDTTTEHQIEKVPGLPIRCNYIAIGPEGKATAFEKKPKKFYPNPKNKNEWWWARDSHLTSSGIRHDWATDIYWPQGIPGHLYEVIQSTEQLNKTYNLSSKEHQIEILNAIKHQLVKEQEYYAAAKKEDNKLK